MIASFFSTEVATLQFFIGSLIFCRVLRKLSSLLAIKIASSTCILELWLSILYPFTVPIPFIFFFINRFNNSQYGRSICSIAPTLSFRRKWVKYVRQNLCRCYKRTVYSLKRKRKIRRFYLYTACICFCISICICFRKFL